MINENKLEQMTESKHGEIALLAAQIWEKEGKPSGRDEEIWLQAEAQLFAVRKNDAKSSKTAESKKVPRLETRQAIPVQVTKPTLTVREPILGSKGHASKS